MNGLLSLWPAGWTRERRSSATIAAAGALLVAFLWALGSALARLPEPVHTWAGEFASGTVTTVELTLVSGLLGVAMGVVAAVAKMSRVFLIRWPAQFYIWVLRGTPLLVQILFVYFALPRALSLSEFSSAAVALALNVGAYNAEAIRAGIQAIPRGQTEAARSLGLTPFQTFAHVVFPQGMKIALPPLVNNIVALLKDSSLAFSIGVLELANAGQRANAQVFRPVPIYATTATIYLILTTVMTQVSNAIEHRLDIEGRV
jgi:polar amino acid transport system permease protein